MAESFTIRIDRYTAKGTITYQSTQVSRYTVELKGKMLHLEHQHTKGKGKWKIKGISSDVNLTKAIISLSQISRQIEAYIHPRISYSEWLNTTKS